MNLHVIQLNVHKEKFHQCMDNFTQEMIRKYQSGSYPTDPNCGGVNISLTATKSAILCPTDSVLNESSLTCSTYKYQFMALMVSNHNCLYLLLNILNYQNIEDFSIKALLNVTQFVSYIGGAIFVGQCDLGYYANQSSHSCQRCPSLDSGVIIPGDCIPCDSNLNTISCLSESLLTSPFPIYCGLVSQIVSKL